MDRTGGCMNSMITGHRSRETRSGVAMPMHAAGSLPTRPGHGLEGVVRASVSS